MTFKQCAGISNYTFLRVFSILLRGSGNHFRLTQTRLKYLFLLHTLYVLTRRSFPLLQSLFFFLYSLFFVLSLHQYVQQKFFVFVLSHKYGYMYLTVVLTHSPIIANYAFLQLNDITIFFV